MLFEAGFRCKTFEWLQGTHSNRNLTPKNATFWQNAMEQLMWDDSSTPHDNFTRIHEDVTTPFKMCVPFWNVGRQERLALLGLVEETTFAALYFCPDETIYFKRFFQYKGPVSDLILRYLILPTTKGRCRARQVVAFLGKGLTRLQSKKEHLRLRNVREGRQTTPQAE